MNELQIFTLVGQELNLTRAAAVLEISKATVSRALMSLEKRLATRLFERTTRRLVLTEAGEAYHAYAKRAMYEAERGEAAVSQLGGEPRGTLRVAMPVMLARSAAPELAAFLQTYPDLRIEMTLRGGQIDPIAERVDVAFQTTRPSVDSQIIQKRVTVVGLGVFASKEYLATAPPLRSPQDLTQHACFTLTTEHHGTTWALFRAGRAQNVRLRGRVSVGDPVIHRQLCLDGAGIAVLPNWLVQEDVTNKRLVRVLRQWTPNPIELYMLYPTRLSVTPKLKAFVNLIESLVPH